METLKICLVGTTTYPCPPPTYGGEISIYHLALSLDELGHEVTFLANPGSWTPPHGSLYYMRSSYGEAAPPWSFDLEQEGWNRYKPLILGADVLHDFSHTKRIFENYYRDEHRTTGVSTLLGGVYNHPAPPVNVIVWSEAMRFRAMNGHSDYWGTPYKEWDVALGAIKDAHVVPGGTDTDFYCPGEEREDFILWLNRWHPAKGYHGAIELAKRMPDQQFVMAGLNPKSTWSPDHTQGALDAIERAKGVDNIRFEWLPKFPAEVHHEMKRSLYRRAKALLYPVQFQEPFGLAQIESLACGTPEIATNFGSIPEVVQDGKTGFVCNTLEDLVTAVKHVDSIKNDDCRADAVARFDRRVMARNYLAQYKRVMDGEIWGV